jgi:hypothetical protein
MPILLVTSLLAAEDRQDAVHEFMQNMCGPIDLAYAIPAHDVQTRFEHASFGGLDLVRCEGPGCG